MDSYLAIAYYLLLLLLFLIFHSKTTSSSSESLNPTSINELVTEIEDDSFYHHPSWSQKWSLPEFTGEYKATWEKAPWSKQPSLDDTLPIRVSEKKLGNLEPDPSPEQLVKEPRKLCNLCPLCAVSPRQKWIGYGQFEGCLVIDERSLKSIMSSSSPSPRLGEAFVGMIDGWWSDETRYKGFMRVDVSHLWAVWPDSVPEGLITVYDEGPGMAHDA
ncbi:hypothetical protein BDW71DRAFT_201909 [Aspergillus fruticulosus]